MKNLLVIVNYSQTLPTELWLRYATDNICGCIDIQPQYKMYDSLLYRVEDDEYDHLIDYLKMYRNSVKDNIVIVEGYKIFCKLGITIYMNSREEALRQQNLLRFYLDSIYKDDGEYTEIGKTVVEYFNIANYGFSAEDVFKRIKGLIIGQTSQPA